MKPPVSPIKTLLLAVWLPCAAAVFAQSPMRPGNSEWPRQTGCLYGAGTAETFFSAAQGRMRQLNVNVPQGHTTPEEYRKNGGPRNDSMPTFPVVYLLDGGINEDYLHVAGLLQFMDMVDLFAPHILSGIVNENRRYDFTHPATDPDDLKLIPQSGGSRGFIGFLKEAQAYTDTHFSTNGHRTLIGQSLGGLLATEVLLTDPQLFDRYIIVSPSLWWNRGSLLASAAETLRGSPGWKKPRPVEVYIVVGKEGEQMENDAARLAELLKAASIPGLTVDFRCMPDETHATILHNALYQTFLKIGK